MLCSEAVRSPVVFGNSAVGILDTFGKVAPRFWEVFRKTSDGFLGMPKNFGRKWFLHEDAWNGRRELIRAEHRAETARTELAQSWKQRLNSKGAGAGAAPAAAAAVVVAAEELPFEDEDAK